MRKDADFDSYRKRMIKEKEDAIEFANAALLVDLVQILDDFDRAIAAAKAGEHGTDVSAFIEGVDMIREQMASMLERKYGLIYYPSQGEPFDPNVHEAIGRVPSEDATEPVVLEECRKGYMLKNRVIRLAQVIVKTPLGNSNPDIQDNVAVSEAVSGNSAQIGERLNESGNRHFSRPKYSVP